MGRPSNAEREAKQLAAQEASNLELARTKLDELIVKHEGQLTKGVVHEYLSIVSVDFGLTPDKVAELKGLKYTREIEAQSPSQPTTIADEEKEIAPNDPIMLMQQHIDKLEEAISRISHVTGSHNYISELGIKRWTPGKKYMGKKYG